MVKGITKIIEGNGFAAVVGIMSLVAGGGYVVNEIVNLRSAVVRLESELAQRSREQVVNLQIAQLQAHLLRVEAMAQRNQAAQGQKK